MADDVSHAFTILMIGLANLLAGAQCGGHMSGEHNGTTMAQPPSPSSLPHEGRSPAELLAATHLFTIEMVDVSEGPWTKGSDGLEHRKQAMSLRLLERLKGALDVKAGDVFHVDVPQRRESGLVTSDYHGFWSHTDVHKGGRYLVIASGPDSASALMQEPAIQAIHPELFTSDVRAAIAAEHIYKAAGKDAPSQLTATHKVLDEAFAGRNRLHGLYGRYLWVRTEPVYSSAEDQLLPVVEKIILAKDATIDLRQSLIEGLYEYVGAADPSQQRSLRVARPLLALLTQPEASVLVDRLAQVQLYNLLFHDGTPIASAHAVVPDAS